VAAESRGPRAARGNFIKTIILNSPVKPIRIWMEVGDHDLLNPNAMRDNMHDWVVANENMAKALAPRAIITSSSSRATPTTPTAT